MHINGLESGFGTPGEHSVAVPDYSQATSANAELDAVSVVGASGDIVEVLVPRRSGPVVKTAGAEALRTLSGGVEMRGELPELTPEDRLMAASRWSTRPRSGPTDGLVSDAAVSARLARRPDADRYALTGVGGTFADADRKPAAAAADTVPHRGPFTAEHVAAAAAIPRSGAFRGLGRASIVIASSLSIEPSNVPQPYVLTAEDKAWLGIAADASPAARQGQMAASGELQRPAPEAHIASEQTSAGRISVRGIARAVARRLGLVNTGRHARPRLRPSYA